MKIRIDNKYWYLLHKHTWSPDKNGYPVARINSVLVYLHRLIMELEIGRKLNRNEIVDHKYHNILDVRIDKLRLTDRFGNQQNRKYRSSRGASRVGNKWQARVSHKGTEYYMGLYEDREDAEAVAKAKRESLNFLS